MHCPETTSKGSFQKIFVYAYRIAGKFGGELNLAVWRISQPTAKLKTANIKSFLYFAHEGDRTSRSKLVGVVFALTWYPVIDISLARITKTSTAYQSFKARFHFSFSAGYSLTDGWSP